MFSGWDIFTDGPVYKIQQDHITCGNQFIDKDYSNIEHALLKENCKWFGYLFDMVDWEHFWTFNDDKIKLGGQLQWIRANLEPIDQFKTLYDFHPSRAAHQRFALEVLREIIDD